MTQKKKNTQTFKSSSTGEPCTVAQYVAEIVCMRKRNKENTGNLEYKFWNKSQKEEYQIQIRVANKIIKKYSSKALLHYLNTSQGKKTYSLGFLHSSKKFVLISKFVNSGVAKSFKIVQEEQLKPKKIIDVGDGVKSYKPRRLQAGNNLLTKIRKAENGKDERT